MFFPWILTIRRKDIVIPRKDTRKDNEKRRNQKSNLRLRRSTEIPRLKSATSWIDKATCITACSEPELVRFVFFQNNNSLDKLKQGVLYSGSHSQWLLDCCDYRTHTTLTHYPCVQIVSQLSTDIPTECSTSAASVHISIHAMHSSISARMAMKGVTSVGISNPQRNNARPLTSRHSNT